MARQEGILAVRRARRSRRRPRRPGRAGDDARGRDAPGVAPAMAEPRLRNVAIWANLRQPRTNPARSQPGASRTRRSPA